MTAEAAKVGCFQILLLFLLAINYVIVAMSHVLPVFHNYTPKFYCESTAVGTNKTYGCANSQSFENLSLLSRVWRTEDNFTSCANGYTWESEKMEKTEKSVVTDWSLICEKGHLSYLGPTIYYIGVSIGAWVAGVVADRIGRLPVLAICLYTQGTMSVATYIVQSYPAFLVLRGLQGIFAQGLQNSTYILVLELFPKKIRTLVAMTMEIGWSLGLVLLATLSYFITDWRTLQLAVSVPTALTVLYIWIIPESPRWLLAKGKTTEADIALEKIVKYNACCAGRSRRVLVAEAVNSENSTPAKPERKSRLVRAVDETTDATKGESGESMNLLTPPNPVKRKSRRNSVRAIAENLEKRLSISNAETAVSELPSREENSETDAASVGASISTRSNRDSAVSSTSGRNAKIDETEGDEPPRNETTSTTEQYGKVCELEKAAPSTIGSSISGDNGEIRMPENEEIVTITKLPEVTDGVTKEAASDENRDIEGVHEIDPIAACSPRRSRYLTKHLTVMAYQWLAASATRSVVLGTSTGFSDNRHVNLAVGGCSEAIVYVLAYFVLTRHGRRVPMSLCQLFNGVICITVGILAVSRHSAVGWIEPTTTAFLFVGRVTIVFCVAAAYLFTVEIFPTVTRGACLGLCVISGMVGTLSAPYILSIRNHTPVVAPLSIVGILSLSAGLVCLILPETVNERLPDTAQQMGRKSTRNKIGVAGCDYATADTDDKQSNREILRKKLFSEDWVDAGNGIIVNFSENKN